MMPKLQNAVMDMYTGFKDPDNLKTPVWNREETDADLDHEALINVVKTVYETAAENSPMRVLCVKTLMWITVKDLEPEHAGTVLEEFVGPGLGMDLIKEFLKIPMVKNEYFRNLMEGVELIVPEE